MVGGFSYKMEKKIAVQIKKTEINIFAKKEEKALLPFTIEEKNYF